MKPKQRAREAKKEQCRRQQLDVACASCCVIMRVITAIDLLIQLLHFAPGMRISAAKALEHPYVAQFHDLAVERTASKPVHTGGFVGGLNEKLDDNSKATTHHYRTALYSEMIKSKKGPAEPAHSSRSNASSSYRAGGNSYRAGGGRG